MVSTGDPSSPSICRGWRCRLEPTSPAHWRDLVRFRVFQAGPRGCEQGFGGRRAPTSAPGAPCGSSVRQCSRGSDHPFSRSLIQHHFEPPAWRGDSAQKAHSFLSRPALPPVPGARPLCLPCRDPHPRGLRSGCAVPPS